jgi:membrane-associated HD superfamily phosphohydrolase
MKGYDKMKKIIACIIVYLLMVVFMFTAIKLNAAELVENEPTQEEVVNPDVDNVTPPIDNTPTTDDNTQEEVDKVPTIVIEDKAKEITDYIIALVISFLGSSTFYAIVKALTKKGINALKDKVKELERQNQINQEAKELLESQIETLNNKLSNATDKMDVVLDKICKRLEIDDQKQKQMAELLEKLLPPLTIEKDDIKEGD